MIEKPCEFGTIQLKLLSPQSVTDFDTLRSLRTKNIERNNKFQIKHLIGEQYFVSIFNAHKYLVTLLMMVK